MKYILGNNYKSAEKITKLFRLSDLLFICLHVTNEEHARLTIPLDLLDRFVIFSTIENRLEPHLLDPTRCDRQTTLTISD